MNWQPHWYLSYSGQKGVTSDCVGKVKMIIEHKPELGRQLDEQMAKSVDIVTKALEQEASQDSLEALAQGISLAENCFEQWGLINGQLGSHIEMLKSNGAIACKPTGSGGGGYVLSLWQEEPSKELRDSFLSLRNPDL